MSGTVVWRVLQSKEEAVFALYSLIFYKTKEMDISGLLFAALGTADLCVKCVTQPCNAYNNVSNNEKLTMNNVDMARS